jgi:hypothetical protein
VTRSVVLLGAAALAGCATLPEPAPGALEASAARYTCDDGTRFTGRFDRFGEAATLTFEQPDPNDPDALAQDRDFRIVLEGRGPGINYAGSGWSFREGASGATLSRPDGRTARCAAGDAGVAPGPGTV